MEIHAANIRKLIFHIWDKLVVFETLLAKLGLKISGYHVIYGVTFPAENLTAFRVVFRASGSCLGTVRSRWHLQAGFWMWCQLEKQGTIQTGRPWTHFRTSAKKVKRYLDAMTQDCEWELLTSRAMIAKSPRGWLTGPSRGVYGQHAASLASILYRGREPCQNCCLLSCVQREGMCGTPVSSWGSHHSFYLH